MRSQESRSVAVTGGEPLVALSRAAELFGVSASSLRAAVERGAVRHRERRPYRRGELILFDERELEADLALLPRCRTETCDSPVFHRSGFCARCTSTQRGWRGKSSPEERTRRLDAVRKLHAELEPGGQNTPGEIARRLGYSRPTIIGDLESLELTWPGKGTRPITRPSPSEIARRRRVVVRHAAADLKLGAIADATGWSKEVIVKDFDALGLPRPGRGRRVNIRPEAERLVMQARAAELYRDGRSEHEIATELGVSRSQVHRDLARAKVEKRGVGPRRGHPVPIEQHCELCGEPFTPRWGGKVARFHSRECQRRASSKARADALAARSLLSTEVVADRLLVVPRVVNGAIERGELQAEWVEVPGVGGAGGCWGITEAAVASFSRRRARDRRPIRESWRNPQSALRRLEGVGRIERLAHDKRLTVDEARQIELARLKERARREALQRRGRRPSTRKVERWAEQVSRTLEELRHDHSENMRLGIAHPADAPSHWLACLYGAGEDWRMHPQDWPRTDYPASSSDPHTMDRDFERAAANRVATALKRLQIAHTK